MKRVADVSPNEMEVLVERGDTRCSAGPSTGETVRPTEMCVHSHGGEEAVAPRVPAVPSKPTQAEQEEHYATGHAVYRSWCEHRVRGRGRASPHVIAPEGELPGVGVDYAYIGPEGIPGDYFGVQMRTHRVPRSDAGAREGCARLRSSFLCWLAARSGMEATVDEARQ